MYSQVEKIFPVIYIYKKKISIFLYFKTIYDEIRNFKLFKLVFMSQLFWPNFNNSIIDVI